MCVDVVTKGTVEGKTRVQRLLRRKLSCQLGRPVKLVFVGGWFGMGQHTHAFVPDSDCRSQGENWESTTTNFSPSRLGLSATAIGQNPVICLVRITGLGQERHT